VVNELGQQSVVTGQDPRHGVVKIGSHTNQSIIRATEMGALSGCRRLVKNGA